MATTGVVCYIRDRGRVLLQHKAPGRFGAGRWNAPGGKMADGESPEQAVVRELREETGLTVGELRDHGTVVFYQAGIDGPDIIVQVFVADRFEGVLQPSDEGPLAWFPEDALPYDEMWEDDRFWLPQVLAGHRVQGSFWFTVDYKKMLRHELRVE
jgi:8-oxo-dGTP diphosphatase